MGNERNQTRKKQQMYSAAQADAAAQSLASRKGLQRRRKGLWEHFIEAISAVCEVFGEIFSWPIQLFLRIWTLICITFKTRLQRPKTVKRSPAPIFQLQDYGFSAVVGHGSQGVVWEAVMKDGKVVVIKCLHNRYIDDFNGEDADKRAMAHIYWAAFRNEVGILEAAIHPNIVKIIGRSADFTQILLEKAGMDLGALLRAKHDSITLEQCHRWFKDVLTGVAHLHAIGVTHTDLKPDNLLTFEGETQIKICDFGGSHFVGVPCTKWQIVAELSTIPYRAPELLLGASLFDDKIDVWSVGCIAMEILCGTVVFQGELGDQFLSKCPPPTHRNFHSDQLRKVLQETGTPRSLDGYDCASLIQDWPSFDRKIEGTVKKYCHAKRIFFKHEHPGANGSVRKACHSSTLWSDTIGRLLMVLPGERINCRDALATPLFSSSFWARLKD
jgi:serine/threonine protein kinase